MFFALRKMGLAPALGAKYFWIKLAFSAPRRIAITIVLGTRQRRICHIKLLTKEAFNTRSSFRIAYNPLAFRAAGMDIPTSRHW
jgi:hypothetical protein